MTTALKLICWLQKLQNYSNEDETVEDHFRLSQLLFKELNNAKIDITFEM